MTHLAERLYDAARDRAITWCADPDIAVDQNGRPILLDAAVRIASARAELARLTTPL